MKTFENKKELKVYTDKVLSQIRLIQQDNSELDHAKSSNSIVAIERLKEQKKKHVLDLCELFSELGIECELNESEL